MGRVPSKRKSSSTKGVFSGHRDSSRNSVARSNGGRMSTASWPGNARHLLSTTEVSSGCRANVIHNLRNRTVFKFEPGDDFTTTMNAGRKEFPQNIMGRAIPVSSKSKPSSTKGVFSRHRESSRKSVARSEGGRMSTAPCSGNAQHRLPTIEASSGCRVVIHNLRSRTVFKAEPGNDFTMKNAAASRKKRNPSRSIKPKLGGRGRKNRGVKVKSLLSSIQIKTPKVPNTTHLPLSFARAHSLDLLDLSASFGELKWDANEMNMSSLENSSCLTTPIPMLPQDGYYLHNADVNTTFGALSWDENDMGMGGLENTWIRNPPLPTAKCCTLDNSDSNTSFGELSGDENNIEVDSVENTVIVTTPLLPANCYFLDTKEIAEIEGGEFILPDVQTANITQPLNDKLTPVVHTPPETTTDTFDNISGAQGEAKDKQETGNSSGSSGLFSKLAGEWEIVATYKLVVLRSVVHPQPEPNLEKPTIMHETFDQMKFQDKPLTSEHKLEVDLIDQSGMHENENPGGNETQVTPAKDDEKKIPLTPGTAAVENEQWRRNLIDFPTKVEDIKTPGNIDNINESYDAIDFDDFCSLYDPDYMKEMDAYLGPGIGEPCRSENQTNTSTSQPATKGQVTVAAITTFPSSNCKNHPTAST